jgi:hypothetical protein
VVVIGSLGTIAQASRTGSPHSRRRWIWLAAVLLVLLVALVVFVTGRPDAEAPISGADPPRAAVTTELGVFRGTDPEAVQAFGTWLGRPVDLVVDFSSRATWAQIAAPTRMLEIWKNSPYRHVYSVGLLPTDDQSATIEHGATGEYDHYFSELARQLISAGQPDATIRLGWEFNLQDSRWATGDSSAFIRYWRAVVTAMRGQPGQEFTFDWNPNNGNAKYDAVKYYPGDDVVDYVGVDAYDVAYVGGSYPYPRDCDAACRLGRQQRAWQSSIYGGRRGLKFWSRFAGRHGKLMSLPEWGLWNRADGHGGLENPYYLRKMSEFIANPGNSVGYQSYFEFDGPDGTHRLMVDYPSAGVVFRSLFAAPG